MYELKILLLSKIFDRKFVFVGITHFFDGVTPFFYWVTTHKIRMVCVTSISMEFCSLVQVREAYFFAFFQVDARNVVQTCSMSV